jgi:multiple sugar transport system ATP-binding protein
MRIELSDLHRKLGATMIYVTHDQVEAMTMADKIVVLNGGQIEQVGSPMELYNAPVSPFVAGFIGSPKMNLYPGPAAGEACATYGIRPEHLRLTNDSPRWTGTVRHVEQLGADTVVYLDVPGMGEMVVRTDGDTNPPIGSVQGVVPIPGREFRFE